MQRRLTKDDGVVAVLVAVLAVALFGFAALVLDVGAMYYERRELQNGADAAAFAVAERCAAGDCGPYLTYANDLTDRNALDLASRIDQNDERRDLCGSPEAGLPTCISPPAGLAGSGYVRVTARTQESDGSNLLPPFLAKVLDPDYEGVDVGASATVIWGSPGGVDAQLAITFSQCEYDRLTRVDGEVVYGETRTIYFRNSTKAGTCGSGLSGGFGWLDAEDGCAATVEDGWADEDPGIDVSQECKDALKELRNKTLLIPVFNGTNGLGGANGEYKIWSYVGFVLTGYSFPGTSHPNGKGAPCSGTDKCIRGYFTEVVAPDAGPVGDGPDQGVRVVQLVS